MSSLLEGASEDQLLAKFTCAQEHDIGSMIRNIPPAQPSRMRRESFRSSLGLLDILPAELLLLTLNLVDFQTLSRLSGVSLKGKAVVETLATYVDVIRHAPTILTALGRTRLLYHHPAVLLRRALRSGKCVSCFCFGAFLFLPTCERVCFECLHENHSLRMTTINVAKQCFQLTERQLKRIPIIIKQVKQLAIEVHGTLENLPEPERPRACSAEKEVKKFWLFKRFREAPLEPPGCDMSQLPGKSNLVEDDFGGVATIRFPYLTDVGAD
ncbi:uncharacterized protein MKZ38_008208 [Zalerion maritima]|uniref:F-box domain-containing protein n=1 Tax=Zalerion maritima TaxID=339359 RepID=A0AAD5RHR7_9PEZI|nr:uncharacterized protein MKZ38_008208 [Zalerion maritima]